MKFFTLKENSINQILNFLFLLSSLSLFLFYKNMFYLHIIAISSMMLMLVKSYYRGIKKSMVWLSLIIFPILIQMFWDRVLTIDELSEILLILVPSIIVGFLAGRGRRYVRQLKETYISELIFLIRQISFL